MQMSFLTPLLLVQWKNQKNEVEKS